MSDEKLYVKQGEDLNIIWTGSIPKTYASTGYLLKWQLFHDNNIMIYASNSISVKNKLFNFLCSNAVKEPTITEKTAINTM